MWVFTNFAFFSVVQHRQDPELVLIRARIRGDLEKLKEKYLPNLGEVLKTPTKADYPYRALAWKVEFAEAMKKAAMDIDYANFKSSVNDTHRHNLYMSVWSIMAGAERRTYFSDYEPKGKKGKKKKGEQSSFSGFGGTNYKSELDIEGSRKAREARLAASGSPKLAKEISDEARQERNRVEALVTAQLRGGPDDFDKDFIEPGTDRELEEAERDLDPTGQWQEMADRIYEQQVTRGEEDPDLD